ncbi:27873_t:CDS:1, partial [Racocetra persica]
IDATQYENQVDDKDDQIFLDNKFEEDFDLAKKNIYLANDSLAK